MLTPLLTLSALASISVSALPATVAIPPVLPGYSKPLYKDHVGLSIEMDRWDSWAGEAVGKPNQYLHNVLGNLAALTGHPTPIRVGANSEDNGVIQPGVLYVNSTFGNATAAVPYPEASVIGIGKYFYALSANFPKGTEFTWGVMLKKFNTTETLAQLTLLYDTFYGSLKSQMVNVTLQNIEIGNEVNSLRGANVTWNNFIYTDLLTDIIGNTTKDHNYDFKGAPKFQIAAYSDTTDYIWSVVGTFSTGLLQTKIGKYINTFSDHHYFGSFLNLPSDPKPGTLVTRGSIRGNLTRFAQGAENANALGLNYVMGETNSFARHGVPGISDGGEAALWLVDYLLQCASVGIARVHFHEGIGFAYNLIQPIAVTGTGPGSTPVPTVQPSYYGALVAAEAIGTYPNTRIAELASNVTNIGAYGIWEDKRLARVVLVNSELWNPGQNGTRPNTTVNLRGFQTGAKASIRRLYTPYTNSSSGLTWGGQSFNTADGKPSGAWAEDWLSSSVVSLNASSVALICFK